MTVAGVKYISRRRQKKCASADQTRWYFDMAFLTFKIKKKFLLYANYFSFSNSATKQNVLKCTSTWLYNFCISPTSSTVYS